MSTISDEANASEADQHHRSEGLQVAFRDLNRQRHIDVDQFGTITAGIFFVRVFRFKHCRHLKYFKLDSWKPRAGDVM
jgi:hypothetical protein